jgi:hypothetical protein
MQKPTTYKNVVAPPPLANWRTSRAQSIPSALLGGSLVENHGLKIGFWAGAAIFALSLLVSQKLEYDDGAAGKAVSDKSAADEEASGEEAESGWRGLGAYHVRRELKRAFGWG